MKMMKNRFVKLFVIFTVVLVWLLEGTFLNYPYQVMGASEQTFSSTDSSNINMDDITSKVISGEKTYIEKNISLPKFDDANREYIEDMVCNPKGLCELFSLNLDDSNAIIGCYRYTLVNGEWKKSEINWNKAFGELTSVIAIKFKYASDGNLYCFAVDIYDDSAPYKLVKISEAGNVDIIDAPVLSTKINSMYPQINSYDISSDNKFIFTTMGGSGIYYDLNTKKVLYSVDNYYPLQLVSNTDNVTFVDLATANLVTISVTTGSEISHQALLENYDPRHFTIATLRRLSYIKLCSDGKNVYVADQKHGIYSFQSGKKINYVSGYANKTNQPTSRISSFSYDRNGSFYTLSIDADYSYSLKCYSPVNTSDLKYQSKLTVAFYQEDDRVSETLYLFSQKHPEIKIDSIYLSDKDSVTSQKAKLKQADMIVCGSYLTPMLNSAGLLKEIGSTTQSLIKSEGLYSNIIQAFYDKDKLYTVPTEFTPYVYAGNKSLLASTKSLSSLQKYAKKNRSVWKGLGYETLGFINYEFFNSSITNKDGSWNKTGLKNLLSGIKQTCTINNKDQWNGEDEWFDFTCYNQYINNKNSLLATEINEPDDLMMLLAATNLMGDSYISSGSFEVSNIVSINKSADTALTSELLTILYSDKVQTTSIGHGIPMKIQSLNTWTDAWQTYRTLYEIKQNINVYINQLESNDIKNFQDILMKLKNNVAYNNNQANSMAQAMQPYLTGKCSLSDTISKIVKGS